MKKYILSVLIIPDFLLIFSNIAQAAIIDNAIGNLQNIGDRDYIGINVSDNAGAGVANVVGGIIEVVLAVLGVIFLALTVYGGWIWMTAAGNQEKVDKAKNLLRDSVIGLAVVISAFALTRFVIEGVLNASTG